MTEMRIRDYLIDHENIDWPKILTDWSWLLPSNFTLWFMNRFGDLFVVLDDTSIWMLDVGGGTFQKVAENREHFAVKLDEEGNADDWLMIPLVDAAVAAGMQLREGQCYSYKLPPVLGGEYAVENVFVIDIPKHFGAYGSIHTQIKDVPDGTAVVLKVGTPPRADEPDQRKDIN